MPGKLSRRHFLASSAAGVLAACRSSAPQRGGAVVEAAAQTGRVLLKGGCVLSLDPAVGDFAVADVLIDGSRIAAVGPNLTAPASIVDASNMIVMPGFVDTHRHMWQGALRNSLPNGLLADYSREILGVRSLMRPEDVRIGDLVTALGAINAGVTTVLDWSHIGNSPEHTDAAIDGLRASGVRAVYGFGAGTGPLVRYPDDLRRLRKQHFASADQLLTLALAGGMSAKEWAVARDVGAPISVHAGGTLAGLEKVLGPDVTYIHCTTFTDGAWKLVAGSGGHVSIACPIEMEMGLGIPPIQQSLDHGIRPSLSVDVETEMPGDMFTQMRSVFTLQRMLALNPGTGNGGRGSGDGKRAQPQLLTVRDVIEFATIAGARANQLDRKIGTLSPGKDADIIMLRTDAINVMPMNNAYGAVVLAMDTSNVDTVFIAGKVVKQGGRLVGVDLARIRREAEQSRDYIAGKAGWDTQRLLR
jgi:cytosine/adenosine deaminase-related metal-dependent hydrolase